MSLKLLLLEKINRENYISRDDLRTYGRNLETDKIPHGADIATTDRKLRELTRENKIQKYKENCFIKGYMKIDFDLTTGRIKNYSIPSPLPANQTLFPLRKIRF